MTTLLLAKATTGSGEDYDLDYDTSLPEVVIDEENEDGDYDEDQIGPTTTKTTTNTVFKYLKDRYNLTSSWAERKSQRVPIRNLTVTIERIDWLRQRLDFSEDDMRTIINRYPTVVQLRPDTNLEPTIAFLKQRLELNDKSLARLIRRTPSILGNGIGTDQTLPRNLDWIESRFKLHGNPKAVSKLVLDSGGILLSTNVENNLEPTLAKLQERLDLNETELVKFCLKAPTVLLQNYTTGIEPKLDWFEDRFDLNKFQMKKIILRHPKLLLSSVENTFEPNIAWLKDRLLLDEASVRKIILRQPAILYYSTTEKMEPFLLWLQSSLSVDDVHVLAWVVKCHPSLFDFSITRNLEPTLEFFKECIGTEQAVKFVLKYPKTLSYGLETRLKPRLKQVKELGIELDEGCLQRMCQNTNSTWSISLAYQQKRLASKQSAIKEKKRNEIL